ncbi:MAG TPA: hypothetical protein PKY77_02230 [Phycisphaerae bacterium]|nr:hypothetical protein [Phycisphaerae bacterium]HRY66560.1 hypothetical protein [Phycisphaerae bacterium]HSA26980.1 hypothetical protein [Phycisphaerae bacterium]
MMASARLRLSLLVPFALFSAVPIALAVQEKAQTFKLDLKKITESGPRYLEYGKPPTEEALRRWCSSQHVWSVKGARRGGEEGKTFESLAKKEPTYASEFAIKGVVKLGQDSYPFACDAADLNKTGFEKFYFDGNRNGDLTDDPVVTAKKTDLDGIRFGGDYVPERSFPRVEVKIRVGDGELDYAFFLTAQAYQTYMPGDDGKPAQTWQGYAQFSPAVYREGEVTLDGKRHRISLLDYNSNGSFDDVTALYGDEEFRKQRRIAYAINGDMLLVDPDPKAESIGYGYDVIDRLERRHVSKLVWIDGRYWDMKVAPSGETITLSPSDRPTGTISNPAARYHAVVYGDLGFLAIHGGKEDPNVLPEGEWRLLEYTIDLTERKKPATGPAATQAAKAKASKSLLGALFASITGRSGPGRGRPDFTLVSANAPWEFKAVKVTRDQASPMPFGPPYKPSVSVGYFPDKNTANLQMQLVGLAGEECSNLMVEGERPPTPTFSIATTGGEIIERGKFEYG